MATGIAVATSTTARRSDRPANAECRIDSIAQTWSVISGAGEPERAERALAALDRHLVRREDGLVLLLTPPFDRSVPDPGYIQAYPPGIRENGGQYTHAAAWSVIAFAMLGDGDKAAELFSMLNPINRAPTLDAAQRYKVEPYVVAARRVLSAAARGARRLDLVHGLGSLDVSRGPRVDAGLPDSQRDAAARPVHPPARGRDSRSPCATAEHATRSRSRIRAA